jgi:mono/diheme cytochrome c family protein
MFHAMVVVLHCGQTKAAVRRHARLALMVTVSMVLRIGKDTGGMKTGGMSANARRGSVWLGMMVATVALLYVYAVRIEGAGVALRAPGQAAAGAPSQAPSATTAATAAPAAHRATLDKYCVTCHNSRTKTAGLALDAVNINNLSESAEIWEKVAHMLRAGAMPPAGMPRPEAAVSQSMAGWLETELDRVAAAAPNPGRVPPHRLNRVEYTNAVRDLLGLDIPAALLPVDGSFQGFDNIAGVLSVSPLLLERYMSVARQVSRMAVGDLTMNVAPVSYVMENIRRQTDRPGNELPFGSRGIALKHVFPLDGEYIVKVRLRRDGNEYIRGLGRIPQPVEVRVDGERVGMFADAGLTKGVPPPEGYNQGELGDAEWEKNALEGDSGYEVRFAVVAGAHSIGVALPARRWENDEELLLPPGAGNDEDRDGHIAVGLVEVSGPYEKKAAADSPSRQKIFTCRPSGPADQEACAQTILTGIARKAYRRPLTTSDTAAIMRFCAAGMIRGFDGCIQSGIERILSSPHFLFRVAVTQAAMADPTGSPRRSVPANAWLSGVPAGLALRPVGSQGGTAMRAAAMTDGPLRLSDFELASRLSFFIWSSVPDDQLLDLAGQGKLKDRRVVEAQVKRMLADPRSRALIENFAGQWLELRRLETVSPVENIFPEFDAELRDAFKRETELYFDSMLRGDRPVSELLTANYTFLNERLARHYGVPNIAGAHFRKVTMTDPRRVGLLGQGSVLTVTSQGTRTAPVLRGKWMLENVLGAPVPPPPPNIPPLKGTSESGEVLTGRAALEQHRKNPVCANCHARMDPWGFALENYDAIGKWRDTEGSKPIDPVAVLLDGTKLDGPVGARQVLLARQDQFVKTVADKLMVYALGRPVEYFDRPALRTILRDAAPANYTWSSLIVGIANSMPFQYQTRGAE